MHSFQKKSPCSFVLFIAFHLLNSEGISTAAELPKVLPIKDDKKIVFATVSQPFALKCPVKDRTAFVDWMKGNESLYLTDGYSMSDTGVVLKIKNVTMEHGGTYTCHVINGHGVVSINFTVIVNDPKRGNVRNDNHGSLYASILSSAEGSAPVIDKSVQKQFKEETGASLAMHCKSSGYSAPHVIWLKDGTRIVKDPSSIINNSTRCRTESTIILKKLKKSDAGIYTCISKNQAGEDEMDFVLLVTDPLLPPEIISVKPRFSTVIRGHTVIFRCRGKSLPGVKLHIKWMKTIPEHERHERSQWKRTFRLGSKYYRVLDTDEDPIMASDGRFQSELLIANTTVKDSGAYVCLAVNDKGYEFKEASLKVVVPALMSPYATASENSSLVMIIVFSASVILVLICATFFYCWCRSSRQTHSHEITNPAAVTVETRDLVHDSTRKQPFV